MDNLSEVLINSKRGCNFGGKIVYPFLYADDMPLLSPLARGLQILLLICQRYT